MARRLKSVTWRLAKIVFPITLGALGGYTYYHFVGCLSGTCAITSNPWLSTAYGALIGSLLVPRRKAATAPENKANME